MESCRLAVGRRAVIFRRMISVVIPTLNAEAQLAHCFDGLIAATVKGLVREVIVADGGSGDGTLAIADAAGAHVVSSPKARGAQLAAGAEAARCDWLLFLHAGTMLEPGWETEAAAFLERTDFERPRAAAFRFALDEFGPAARWLEFFVGLRCWMFGLPYGGQGLLISKCFYRQLGGFRPLPAMEDLDLMRRIGRGRLTMLRARAVTDAQRLRHEGFLKRSARNLVILILCALRVPTNVLARLYG